jgi:hypothetical protein
MHKGCHINDIVYSQPIIYFISTQPSLPACLPECPIARIPEIQSPCPPPCLSSGLPSYLPALLPSYLPALLPACLPTCLPSYLPALLPVCLLACLPAQICEGFTSRFAI